jgi:hypothetical protein
MLIYLVTRHLVVEKQKKDNRYHPLLQIDSAIYRKIAIFGEKDLGRRLDIKLSTLDSMIPDEKFFIVRS